MPVAGVTGAHHRLQRRNGAQRAIRRERHVGQLPRPVTADAFAIEHAALEIEEFRSGSNTEPPASRCRNTDAIRYGDRPETKAELFRGTRKKARKNPGPSSFRLRVGLIVHTAHAAHTTHSPARHT